MHQVLFFLRLTPIFHWTWSETADKDIDILTPQFLTDERDLVLALNKEEMWH